MTTDWVTWFRYQLKASADGFEWAVSQIPSAYHAQLPPDPGYLGTWSPARHIWHVTEYERCLVIPSMLEWITEPLTIELDWPDDDEAWVQVQERGAEVLLVKFLNVRQQQIDLLDRLASVDWNEPHETLWGMKPLSMVVTKTFQHTYEHGDTLLRMGLWWEETLEEEAKKAASVGL
jgi:hypothetical protein